jgi:anti-sigma B factor antagonist
LAETLAYRTYRRLEARNLVAETGETLHKNYNVTPSKSLLQETDFFAFSLHSVVSNQMQGPSGAAIPGNAWPRHPSKETGTRWCSMVCMPLRDSERESEGIMALQYRIRKNQQDGGAVLHLTGRLVAGGGALQLRGLSRQLVNQYLEVDLSEVSSVDAAGLGALVFLYNQVGSCGGKLALVNVPARVRQLLRLTGLAGFLPVASRDRELEEAAICVGAAATSPAA